MATGVSIDALREVSGFAVERAATLNPRAAAVPVRDNSKFVGAFDASKVIGVFRPKRTLVVGQDPAAGTFIPVGTPVDLIVTVKDALPLGGLKEIDPRILQRFTNKSVGDVLDTLKDTDAKRVIERPEAANYDALSTADRAAVNAYITNTFGFDASADQAAAKNVFNNVKFLNDL
jgi:hypothetical protein